MDTPALPSDSQIQVAPSSDGITCFWKKKGGGLLPRLIAAFLVFWTLGWIAVLILFVLFFWRAGPPGPFALAWLGIWSLGALFSCGLTVFLLRPQKPESVTLGKERFVYDTGSAPLYYFTPYWMTRKKLSFNPLRRIFQKRKIYSCSRAECPEFVLEGMGDDQRLRFDHGARRITIGEFLSEPEREWLAQVLNDWRQGG
jgi:hypothetical protein